MNDTDFFRRISNRVQQGKTHQQQQQNGNAQQQQAVPSPSGSNKSALLTQASQSISALPGKGNLNGSIKISDDELNDLIRRIRAEPTNTSPNDASAHRALLPMALPEMRNRKCLVLDVDETLVHSSYQQSKAARVDLHLALPVQNQICNVYVAFRPFVREFLHAISPLFEIVIFTASVSVYCNPLMDYIDERKELGSLRLFREHCSNVQGSYVKDLSLLGRDLKNVIIIDNSPIAYLFQQRNAIPITSWFSDDDDRELEKLIPVLIEAAKADTVYDVLDKYNAHLQLEMEKGNKQS